MTFIATRNLGTVIPARGYLYEEGLLETFFTEEAAKEYLKGILDNFPPTIQPSPSFAIGFVWNNREDSIAEIFGYGDVSEWPGNPELYSWVFRNGIYNIYERNISCTDSMQVWSFEDRYRRATPSSAYYRDHPPYTPERFEVEDVLNVRMI